MTYNNSLPADRVDARPSKALFVSMISRDITITDAIMDFVDNSVDQARRAGLKPGNVSQDLNLEITIFLDKDRFVIEDNCGGMPLDIARTRAFRFGREDDDVRHDQSIGRFGIGMKRAFFKIGQAFRVDSSTAEHSFTIKVDVPEWTSTPNEWTFPIILHDESLEEWKGYKVEITNLLRAVSLNFQDNSYIKTLKNTITSSHQTALLDGLKICVNGEYLVADEPTLKSSDALQPVNFDEVLNIPHRDQVRCKIVAGFGDRDPKAAGWYVYCNGRLITRADKTLTTGWGETLEAQIPQYHNDFAWFRGYVFLNSNDPDLLPWNTVKSGIDTESIVFLMIRPKIIAASSRILTFMRTLAAETANNEEAAKPLQEQIKDASSARVSNLEIRKDPIFPMASNYKPKIGYIRFSRPIEKIEEMKQFMGVTRPGEVGEIAFDYYYENEVE